MGRTVAREQPDDPAKMARDVCYRLLAVRPRTHSELSAALARKGIDADVAEEILGKFSRAGLIDDAEFANHWVRSRHANSGLGRRALKSELLRKGVDAETAAQAVAAIGSDDEESRARELVRKRVRQLVRVDETTAVRRLVGMLARKGYPEGLAFRVVREELTDAGHETSLLDDPQSSNNHL